MISCQMQQGEKDDVKSAGVSIRYMYLSISRFVGVALVKLSLQVKPVHVVM